MSRNKARLVAMQALFQLDDDLGAIETLIGRRSEEEKLSDRDMAYLNNTVSSVVDNQEKIDEYIRRFSIDWDIHRLGKVERAILRLAIAEMIFRDDIPVSVSINEAVMLSKKYCAEQSSKFVNGILGKFSRDVLGEKRTSRRKRKTAK